jgi:hypothetical protein
MPTTTANSYLPSAAILYHRQFKFLKLSAECVMDFMMMGKEKRFYETSKFQS